MEYAMFLGILAGSLHLLAFGLYNKQMIQGKSQPNMATWSLWAFLASLNASSYTVMSGDLVTGILPTAGAFACIATFLFSLFKGKLSKLDRSDLMILALGLVSGFIWWYYKSATYANLFLQIPIVLSIIPTYRGVLADPRKEQPLPWYVWSLAYLIMCANVYFFSWKGQYEDLVFPGLALIIHAPVGLLTYRKSPPLELAI